MKRMVAVAAVLLALGGAFLLVAGWPGAAASSLTVNSTADAVDASPGDGVCETAPGNGVCTLRAAVQEANANAGADTVVVPAGTYTLTIPGAGEDAAATGDLDITDDLTIDGAGAAGTIVDGGGIDRVLQVVSRPAPLVVAVNGVTIRNGKAAVFAEQGDFGDGGGILVQGATFALRDAVVTSNVAEGEGGGIAGWGDLTLIDITISSNTGLSGGGIDNRGNLTLTNAAVTGNTAMQSGFMGGSGGGISGFCYSTATLTNVTISGNSANAGGGIDTVGAVALTNVTITGNTAGAGAGGIGTSAGCQPTSVGTATLVNTIVSGNMAAHGSNCEGSTIGSITSLGHNLDGDDSCHMAGPGDLSDTDPKLGPLADNGGPSQTHALLSGSPAIDAGDSSGCPPADQRGVARPQGAACDIGAYESEAVAPGTATPSPTSSVTPTPSPVASTWKDTCYIGTEQPIQQALADIIGDVQAVYRLNSSQSFDRWFPGRPEVSNIETLNPYQPLLILMSAGATWSQEPSGTPPGSASLVQGWNSVCYAGQTEPPGDATASIGGAFSILYRLGSDQAWSRYVPDRPEVSNIVQLTQYDAVLLLVNAEGGAQWVFNP